MKKNSSNRTKLSELLAKWPKGVVATSPWLERQGVSADLVKKYNRSGWVRRIERGAYGRLEDTVEWTGALHAVQYQLKLSIHLGAKRALEVQGYGHYVRQREGGTLRLYGPHGMRLPTWLARHDWGVKIKFTAANLFPSKMAIGLTERPAGDFPIRLSAPERAMLETLDDVPGLQSFAEARLLMGGLTTLRPELVQELLETCRSIKAKRLFLFLAEEAGHAWVKELNPLKVNLGKGKRSIVKGGRFDPKYQITVETDPEAFSIRE
ncbi:MAG: type IV toxin-antitoxin system AbiEi family antitoxin domain-containing protein, partial [Elusimicrobiota bacterium]